MAIKNIQTSHLVHDLKNPVNIIETGARTLLEKQDRYGELTPKQEKVVRRVLRNALKIKALTNSMLEVDMSGHGVTNLSQCTLSDIVKHSLVEVFDIVDPGVSDAIETAVDLKRVQEALGPSDVRLEVDETQFKMKIHTDQTKMGLILTNLLSNALKFKQREVRVKCSIKDDSLFLSVKDDEPGIPESYHQQIFDQYFQCVKVEGFPVRGHGLGLAGALALTEALGGSLSLCKCEKGAEFLVQVNCSPKD